jgi:hypothetical protein
MASTSDALEYPWESSSSDKMFSSQQQEPEQSTGELPQESGVSARLDWHSEGNTPSSMDFADAGTRGSRSNRQRLSDNISSHHKKYCENLSIAHVLLTVDGGVILLLLLFSAYTLQQDDSQSNGETSQHIAILTVCILLAVLIAWRGLLLSCLFPTKRCSKSCSTHLTLVLGGTYAVLALSGWIVISGNDVVPWCWSLGQWCTGSRKVVPSCLMCLAIVEALRFCFAVGQLSQFDQDHPQSSSPQQRSQPLEDEGSFSTSRRSRPWWWNRHGSRTPLNADSDIHESLLENNGQPGWSSSGNQSYLMDDGVSPSNNRGLFGGWFGRVASSSNPRDYGSVDYESLNEEWASRSEEDPYWWTREENNNDQ